jgi:hypothetical protein
MDRIVAVITDPETGRARLGTVALPADLCSGTEPPVRVDKNPGEAADPHHPAVPTLLTIGEGSHSIFVPSGDGRSEIECRLRQGDRILFLDFPPERPPVANRRFCYAGHWSQAGPAGAVLLRISLPAIDPGAIGWQDGLPEK